MPAVSSELEVIFATHHLRLTKPRQVVFAALKAAQAPLAIGDIVKLCPQIDRVSIYRTLDVFVKLGIAEAVPVGWKQRYELTSPFQAHHHHLYCTNCGKLVDIHSKKLELVIASIARDYDFTPREHTFEVSGLCQKCSRTST